MKTCRGMGVILASKTPKGKEKSRSEDMEVSSYAKGGVVKMAGGGGLYANIAAKKKRIAAGSGESMKSAGEKGAPKKSDFANAAKTARFAKGGEAKSKSKVNEAGNYTKPTMRKALFERIKAGSKGGDAGQWSGRKAQLLASEYKKSGGGYRD